MRSVFIQKPDPLDLRLRTAGLRQLWVWFPVVLAISVIAMESTSTFSSSNTSGWLRPLIQRLFGQVGEELWGEVHHYIRKSGHFIGYGTVCLTFLRAWLLTLGRRVNLGVAKWHLQSCLLAIASAAMVASSDEFHQTFIPGRTGIFSDVILDSVGGTAACTLVWLLFWRGRHRNSSEPHLDPQPDAFPASR